MTFGHVLFHCKTTVLGELALKAVEFVQVRCQALACRPHRPSMPSSAHHANDICT